MNKNNTSRKHNCSKAINSALLLFTFCMSLLAGCTGKNTAKIPEYTDTVRNDAESLIPGEEPLPSQKTEEIPEKEPTADGETSGKDDLTAQPSKIPEEGSAAQTVKQLILDGSTSTIPFEEAIRRDFLGENEELAAKSVFHTTAYGSFYNLIERKCDLIFTTPLIDTQREAALSKGITLTEVPI